MSSLSWRNRALLFSGVAWNPVVGSNDHPAWHIGQGLHLTFDRSHRSSGVFHVIDV
jgi:hypothetical protein